MSVKITYSGRRPTDLAREIRQVYERDIPREIRKKGLEHFNKAFTQQGFTDETFEPWKKRKVETNKSKGRAILVKSGRLRRGNTGVIMSGFVRFSNSQPHAQVHNEGFNGTQTVSSHKRQNILRTSVSGSFQGTARKRKKQTLEILKSVSTVKSYNRHMNIPRRQFIGPSVQLRTSLRESIRNIINQKLKS